MNYETTITIFTVIAVVTQILNYWFLSKGMLKMTYRFSSVTYLFYLVIDLMLAMHDSEQWSMYLFTLTNVWALTMSLKGFARLRHAEKIS